MPVTVQFPQAISGQPMVITGCRSISALMARAWADAPEIAGLILENEREPLSLKPYIVMFLDGEIVDEDSDVSENSEVILATAFSGG